MQAAVPLAAGNGAPLAAPQEAEVIRVRSLGGFWRWLLAAAAAATIFLCINQQFVLRFFVGFTPLNTEYYYALVLVMLPFVFVIFPAAARAPLARRRAADRGTARRAGARAHPRGLRAAA